MQVGHDWNKDGNNYMTASFYGATTITAIDIAQKAVLSGTMGTYFMAYYAYNCSNLTSLSAPDTSGLTSVGDSFMRNYAYLCSNLTSLSVPDTSGLTSVGESFMYYYARDCSNLTSLSAPDTSGLTSVGNNFMYYYAYNCSNLTSLSVPDTSGLTSVGDFFMYYYARDCSSLTSLSAPDTSGLTSAGSGFMAYYAYNCSNLTSLSVPDTSGLTSVGDSFMSDYARGCSNLTSLAIPDTSGLTSVGDFFMANYARDCSSLTSLVLPAVGWFAEHDISWNVPSARLGYLNGYVIGSGNLAGWKALTVQTKTLYINYIQDADDVRVAGMANSFSFNAVDMSRYGLTVRNHNLDDMALETGSMQLQDKAYPLASVRPGLEAVLDVVISAADYATLCTYMDNIKKSINYFTDQQLKIDSKSDRYWLARAGQFRRGANTDKTWEGEIVFQRHDPCAYKNTADSNNHTIATDPDDLVETNGGTDSARPTITITSNADHGETTVEIESATTGEVFQWTGTFDTGDVLVIDCDKMYVTLNSVASMLTTGPEYPHLETGVNNWNTSGFTGTLNITYRDRYA